MALGTFLNCYRPINLSVNPERVYEGFRERRWRWTRIDLGNAAILSHISYLSFARSSLFTHTALCSHSTMPGSPMAFTLSAPPRGP